MIAHYLPTWPVEDELQAGNVLEKAKVDHWQYLLETKTGQQFVFSEINPIDHEWISLVPLDDGFEPDACNFDGPFRNPFIIQERPVMIRLDAITWMADGTS